jgi:hypothetical protein
MPSFTQKDAANLALWVSAGATIVAVIGTFILVGPGTVVGGIVGGLFGGCAYMAYGRYA